MGKYSRLSYPYLINYGQYTKIYLAAISTEVKLLAFSFPRLLVYRPDQSMTGHLTANGFRFRRVRPIDHVFWRHQFALYRRKSTARGKRVRRETDSPRGIVLKRVL